LFFRAEPKNTGVILMSMVPLRMAATSSSSVGSSPSRYLSITFSSKSAAASISFSWYSRACSRYSSGMGISRMSVPRSLP
jgi:hypothetical protein